VFVYSAVLSLVAEYSGLPAGVADTTIDCPIRRNRLRCVRTGGDEHKEYIMSLGTILLVVIILMLIGVLPTWPHARTWGYGPSGAVGVILLILIVLLVMGKI
jgi:Protein of unknown function (DUF3309)